MPQVDEVDSILIDVVPDAAIISGQGGEAHQPLLPSLPGLPTAQQRDVVTVDEKALTVAVDRKGVAKAEKMLGVENLYAPEHRSGPPPEPGPQPKS